MSASVTCAVLAGGDSTRMGTDKALLEVAGGTLLDHVLAAAGGLDTLVVGRRHPTSAWTEDVTPGRRGPLAGLVTALQVTQGSVLLVGADQPWLRRETVLHLAAIDSATPVAPVDRGVRQVLCALYPAHLLEPARRLLEEGRGLQAVLDLGCRDVTIADWSGWGEDGRSWHSVDTRHRLDEGLRRYGLPR